MNYFTEFDLYLQSIVYMLWVKKLFLKIGVRRWGEKMIPSVISALGMVAERLRKGVRRGGN